MLNGEGNVEEQCTNKLTEICQRIEDSKVLYDESTKIAKLADKIEARGEAVCIIGCDGRIVHVNTAFEVLTGYTRDELIGESPFKIHPEREKERISAGLKKCQDDHSTIGFKTFFLRKDKLKIPMRVEFVTYPS